jgi:DNA-binding response OmpR family regulator
MSERCVGTGAGLERTSCMAALPHPAPGVLTTSGSGTHTLPRVQRAPIVVATRDADTRAAIASALGDFDVHEADTLSAAGALVSDLRPRAVVCSVAFDPLELFCFTRWMRAMFARSIAFVALTPQGDAKQTIRALQLGARACIEFPIDPARLRMVMAKHAVRPGSAA